MTGRQTKDMSAEEIKALVGHLDATWFETAIVDGRFLNSILAFVLIVGALLYLNQVSPTEAIVLTVLAVIGVIVLATFGIRRWERPAREELASEPYARLKFLAPWR